MMICRFAHFLFSCFLIYSFKGKKNPIHLRPACGNQDVKCRHKGNHTFSVDCVTREEGKVGVCAHLKMFDLLIAKRFAGTGNK